MRSWIYASSLVLATAVHAITWTATPFNPASIPLAVRTPYLSAWCARLSCFRTVFLNSSSQVTARYWCSPQSSVAHILDRICELFSTYRCSKKLSHSLRLWDGLVSSKLMGPTTLSWAFQPSLGQHSPRPFRRVLLYVRLCFSMIWN